MIDAQSPDVRDRLAAALGVRRWVDEVAAGGPYPSVEELVAASRRVDLTDAELDEALASAAGSRSAPSSGEQAGLGRNDEGDGAAIARGAEVYAQRYGREFLISAGRSREDVLDELQRRLKNDDETEAAEAKQQLREIAVARLRMLFEGKA